MAMLKGNGDEIDSDWWNNSNNDYCTFPKIVCMNVSCKGIGLELLTLVRNWKIEPSVG